MAVAVWAGQTASGGRGLSVAETEERRIAVAKDGAKRAVATRARRRGKALKAAGAPALADWNTSRLSIEYPRADTNT